MRKLQQLWPVDRRTILKTSAAIAAVQITSPFIIQARGETPVKIGMVDPLTGVYAAIAQSEVVGAKVRRRGNQQEGRHSGPARRTAGRRFRQRCRHRRAEDPQADRSRSGRASSSATSIPASRSRWRRSPARRRCFISFRAVTPTRITGANCSWNVFRVCNSTTMDANAIASTLMEKFGKKWYFLTPDYAYGHSVQAGFEKLLKAAGGTSAGALVPLGHGRIIRRI